MSYKFFDQTQIEITHVRGSGPGGQNRNKRFSGVRVLHFSTGITVTATERRSQEQNLAAALERLDEKLAAYYFKPRKRVPTKATKASARRRQEAKKIQARKKQSRKVTFD